jgi:hypothetical protein
MRAASAREVRTRSWLLCRAALAAALALALLLVAAHRDEWGPGGSGALSVDVAHGASHARAAAHVESSETDRHSPCEVCALQRLAGGGLFTGAVVAAIVSPSIVRFTSVAFPLAARTFVAPSGRAPPLS